VSKAVKTLTTSGTVVRTPDGALTATHGDESAAA
jgi:S-DNA-T family DNA segregation ATPase FtsK/SpoIIIE